jgi:hypothetical protein
MATKTPGYDTITKEDFDKLAKQSELWESGPEIETPIPHYGDPYCPRREVRGILKGGRKIRAEV